ncbi:Ejaculatory bulb-specific protein 3 [Camponotus floridanus]|uniref:Ejaculatory bulb-specific protein 3 n=1 Tax=Camponotus floridanus TaxID=104421 RepID=E2APN4_CAMFO|nr:ejaculatory bulb-specific protein 3 [Camponotus floridanus]EFN64585.1 Ejaculatory bulb-specific protein 3 [Camponotus floridanus]
MKLAFLLLLSSFVFFGLVSGTENYTDIYDNVDIDAVLNSDRLLNQYLDCILEKGSCTADARSLKRILPEAVATICEKCNLKQRQGARKIGNHLKKYKPELWTRFLEKYDPNKEYVANFEQFLAQVE